jgi:triacylglycerol lipase
MPFTSSFGLNPQIADRLSKIGAVLDSDMIDKSRALFAEQRDMSLPTGAKRYDHLAYGDHPRQQMDLCAPGGENMPVVLFVPGGGLVGGDKSLYAHIPAYFARKGYLAAIMNYRLAPEFLWPTGAQDVAAALDWLTDNATRYGGDPTRIFVVGQSAGAIHASGAIFDRRFQPRCQAAIRSAALLSGIYEVRPEHEGLNINLYFGSDPFNLPDRSVINHVHETDIPVLLTVAEFDPAYFGKSAGALITALSHRYGSPPEFAFLKGHNHLSPVLGLGGPYDLLGDAIEEALRCRAR